MDALMESTRTSESTYVLIEGAAAATWYWHRVVKELATRGTERIGVELPAGVDSAGLRSTPTRCSTPLQGRSTLIVVAQSMGSFTGVSVCSLIPVRQLVFVNAMIPGSGSRPVNGLLPPARPTHRPPTPMSNVGPQSSISSKTSPTTSPPMYAPTVPMTVATGADDRLLFLPIFGSALRRNVWASRLISYLPHHLHRLGVDPALTSGDAFLDPDVVVRQHAAATVASETASAGVDGAKPLDQQRLLVGAVEC